jgi:V/A-type H+-transporting ATPase subunit K
MGAVYAVIGAALAATLAGIGSSYGVQAAGKAAAGVTRGKPELFSKLFILQLLPATQGIYGLISAIIILIKAGIIGGGYQNLTPEMGKIYLFASLPIALVGLLSGIYQGQTAAAAILMTSKQPDSQTKGIQMTAVVETYAIFALVATIIIVLTVR